MAANSTEIAWGFGQLGSIHAAGTEAITMLADTTFDTSAGLVADNDTTAGIEYAGTDTAAHNLSVASETVSSGGGGVVVDVSNTFPKGITIYGRWTGFKLASGRVIAYLGV